MNPATPSSPERPFATCRKDKKLVGIYCSFDEIASHPEYLDALQEKVGANVIIASHGVHYPPEILELAPFALAHNQWVGLPFAEDDTTIHQCAEILHARGMDLWLYGSGHVDHGNDDRYAPVDFDGRFLRDLPILKYSLEGGASAALCFQKSAINRWQENAYAWICQGFKPYLSGFMRHEYRRAALVRNPDYPSYQTAFPHYWGREITEPLLDEIMDLGHDGYIFESSAAPFVKRPE